MQKVLEKKFSSWIFSILTVVTIFVFEVRDANAELILATGADAVVTDLDMRATAELIPLSGRNGLLARPEAVQEQAKSIYLRRHLAGEATRAGLDSSPVVQTLLTLARERIYSDAALAAFDTSNVPKDAELESYAQQAYKAQPERFQVGEQTRVRHILIQTNSADAKARAQKLLDQIKSGVSFDELAKANSQDATTAPKGGDLGFFGPEAMVQPFQAAVEELKNPGEISGVVETGFGYHLIKLESRRPAGILPYTEVRETLRTEARTRALQEARAAKINKLLEQFKADPAAIDAFTQRYK